MKTIKAFTLMEVLVCCVILCISGLGIYFSYNVVKHIKERRAADTFASVTMAVTQTSPQTMMVGSKTYYVFPKPIYDFKTIEVDGKTLILIPTQ